MGQYNWWCLLLKQCWPMLRSSRCLHLGLKVMLLIFMMGIKVVDKGSTIDDGRWVGVGPWEYHGLVVINQESVD